MQSFLPVDDVDFLFFLLFLWVFHKMCWTLRCYEMCTGHFWWFYMKPEEVPTKKVRLFIFLDISFIKQTSNWRSHTNTNLQFTLHSKSGLRMVFFLSLSSPVQSDCVQLISHPIPFWLSVQMLSRKCKEENWEEEEKKSP